jgi:apolipoprotein N-acyltransferase
MAKSKKKKKGKSKSKAQPTAKAKAHSPAKAKTKAESSAPQLSRKHKWRNIGLCVLSGCMWFLSCADFDIWPLAWIAMVPCLWLIDTAPTRKRAIYYAWLTGVVANTGGFYWVSGLLSRFGHLPVPVAMFGVLLLASYQALVFALFAAAVRTLRDFSREAFSKPIPMALLAPIVMVTFELLVPFIFPWYLAITQAWVVPVIQIAELTGPVGVTALLLAFSGGVYDAVTRPPGKRRFVPLIAASGVVAAALVFGFVRMAQVDNAREAAPKLTIGVVQGNIPFDEKGVDRVELAARQLRDLQQKSAELERKGAELIVWTESSLPYRVDRTATRDLPESHRARIRRGFESPLIFGAVTKDAKDEFPYNSAIMLDRDGAFTARFDKIFLLIFGEYIPGVETFPWIRKWLPAQAGHFARGEEIVTFPLEHNGETYRLGPMICYEDILADFNRKLAEYHPHLLVNITNDAWFGETSEPWEHMALSVYRAVEMRTDLVRAVNTGVSAFIDANGRVMSETYAVDPKINPVGVDGLLDETVLMEGGHTFYAKFGDVFGWLCVALTLVSWLIWPRWWRRRRRSS